MAKHLLTNVSAKALKEPGRHADGDGLYLVVDSYGKRWVLLFQWQGKRREMGLGRFQDVPLAKAREKAAEAKEQARAGIDPIAAKKAPEAVLFGLFCEGLIEDLKDGWTGAKTEASWTRSLVVQAKPLAMKAPDAITTADILDVVKPYWTSRPETGQKLRARLEVALDAAKAKGLRSGENPARWRGHLDKLLSKPQKLTRGHHRALPYAEAPAFMKRLKQKQGMGARALEWTIYTAAREAMTLGMKPDELAEDWTVPADRMKGRKGERKPFIVPVSRQAREMIDALPRVTPYVFPGSRLERPLSNAAMDKVLKDMGVDATPHGFRSTFKDWAEDMTTHADSTSEEALAHLVGSSVRRSYRRGDALEKRRLLMQDWADFLDG